jgi:hypothetical protein
LLIRLGFVLRPLSRTRFFITNANPACSCVYICKFQSRPIHPPPSRRLSVIHSFDEFKIWHISRVENCRANNLAHDASGYRIKQGRFHNTENLITRAKEVLLVDSADNEAGAIDWRTPIINYLQNPSVRIDRNVRRTTFKYVLMSDELYRRRVNDVLLKGLGPGDAILAMDEVHDGICGTHQSAPKMK